MVVFDFEIVYLENSQHAEWASDPRRPRERTAELPHHSPHVAPPPAVTDARDGPGGASSTVIGTDTQEWPVTFFNPSAASLAIDLIPSPGTKKKSYVRLQSMPNEVLLAILSYLDVNDLLSTSRTNHRLRHVSLAPILHVYRLQYTRAILPPLLRSRSSIDDLISRSIFITHTSVVSRRLGRSLVCIRLARRLAVRPSPQELVNRAVLPPECIPGMNRLHVAPALVAKRRAVEKERVKDGLRHWIDGVWKCKVIQREEGVKRWEQSRGIGRVWRLRKFWERVSRGEVVLP